MFPLLLERRIMRAERVIALQEPEWAKDKVDLISATRTHKGITTDLERKFIFSGEDELGQENSVYAYVVPATKNVELFLFLTKTAGGVGAEMSRSAYAEMTVFYRGEELVTFPVVAGIGMKSGYYDVMLT